MKIEVQLFSRLRDLAGSSRLALELPVGATVADALEYVGREQVLREGDSLSIMPPVQGG